MSIAYEHVDNNICSSAVNKCIEHNYEKITHNTCTNEIHAQTIMQNLCKTCVNGEKQVYAYSNINMCAIILKTKFKF